MKNLDWKWLLTPPGTSVFLSSVLLLSLPSKSVHSADQVIGTSVHK